MKKEHMIKGNWYSIKASEEMWIFKFDYLDGEDIHQTLCGTPCDEYIGETGFIDDIEFSALREATIEEVHKLFPEEEFKQMTNYEIY